MPQESAENRFQSRKFLMVTSLQAVATLLLMTKHITSHDWVDASKWTLSSYMAANVLEDKISLQPPPSPAS